MQSHAYLTYYSTTSREELAKLYVTIYKTSYIFSVLYPLACALPKLSICCMYLGIFKVHRAVQRAVQALLVFTIINMIAWFIPSVVVCQPISAYWSLTPHLNNCINFNVFGTWITLPHIVTDLIIMALPIPILWHLQMRTAKKIGLILTFFTASMYVKPLQSQTELTRYSGIIGGCLRTAFYIQRTYVDSLHSNESPSK